MSKKLMRIAVVLAMFMAFVVMLFCLNNFVDVHNFADNRKIVEADYTPDELARAREMYEVFQANILPDSVTPVNHYVDTWIDVGYTGLYHVLLKDENDKLTVLEYELDSLLASNFIAYRSGISDSFPSKLGFNYNNNVVISPSTPGYENFTLFTTAYVYEALYIPNE